MPDIARLLKEEIRRLSRSEIRSALSTIRRDNVYLKKTVASLKKRVQSLERENKRLLAAEMRRRESLRIDSAQLKKLRVTAQTVRALREKLGLSQAAFARLIGVTAQSVYMWEHRKGRLTLSPSSRAAIFEARKIGAREAKRRLIDLQKMKRVRASRKTRRKKK